MKITAEWLEKKQTCAEGKTWWRDNGMISDPEKLVEVLLKEKKYSWASWVLIRLFTQRQSIMYAIYAAEYALKIYEQEYPNDKRPRQVIEVVKTVLDNKKTRLALRKAAEVMKVVVHEIEVAVQNSVKTLKAAKEALYEAKAEVRAWEKSTSLLKAEAAMVRAETATRKATKALTAARSIEWMVRTAGTSVTKSANSVEAVVKWATTMEDTDIYEKIIQYGINVLLG